MLFDTHCHIPHNRYKKKSEEIIIDSYNSGVNKLITIGTSIEDSEKTLEIASKFNYVYSTIGVYPHEDKNISMDLIHKKLRDLHHKYKSKIVGIGECGIDISKWEGGRAIEDQVELFKLQIGFAIEHNLPVVLHSRNGDEHIKKIFSKYQFFKNNKFRGVAHCFVGDWDFASYLLDFGFYISFSGIITFPNVSKDLAGVVSKMPEDKIVIETDSPDLAPQIYRGEINYPKYVKIVAEKVAQIRNTSFDKIADATYKNSCKLFGI